MSDLSKKKWVYSLDVRPFFKLDSLNIASLVNEGDINFGASETKRDSCKIYTIETKIGVKEYDLKVENCVKKVTVLSVVFLD